MVRFLKLFAFISMLATPTAVAKPLVAELFVSKNCEACPAAIALMDQKVEMHGDDLLLLTWSVDYWDYLGTADPMALPEAKTRQRRYAENMSIRGPYTPQVVFNGSTHCPGNREDAVEREMAEYAADEALLIDANLEAEGTSIALGSSRSDLNLSVSIVEYANVGNGKMMLTNAVTSHQMLGSWNGSPTSFPVSCKGNCAVLVQEAGYGEVLHAVRVRGPESVPLIEVPVE